MYCSGRLQRSSWFAPPRGRGLKLLRPAEVSLRHRVRPPTGAWIETTCSVVEVFLTFVRPPTGAWIETTYVGPLLRSTQTFAPPRGRGLKRDDKGEWVEQADGSPPHGGVD